MIEVRIVSFNPGRAGLHHGAAGVLPLVVASTHYLMRFPGSLFQFETLQDQ
jgi:predicted N-acyltransferase